MTCKYICFHFFDIIMIHYIFSTKKYLQNIGNFQDLALQSLEAPKNNNVIHIVLIHQSKTKKVIITTIIRLHLHSKLSSRAIFIPIDQQ